MSRTMSAAGRTSRMSPIASPTSIAAVSKSSAATRLFEGVHRFGQRRRQLGLVAMPGVEEWRCPALARCIRRANRAAAQRHRPGFGRCRLRWPGWPADALAATPTPPARPKPGAHQRAVGAEGQRRRKPAAIGDTAGGHHQRFGRAFGDEVDDLGHQRESGAGGHAVAAGLTALRHDDVRAGVQRLARMVEVLHLGDQRNTGRADAVGERPQVTERQHDGGRLPRQGLVEQLGLSGQAPGDEPAADLGPDRLGRIRAAASRRRRSRRRSGPGRRRMSPPPRAGPRKSWPSARAGSDVRSRRTP